MRISAVVAMAENRVIGYENRLPWHMPADLRHFKAVTLGKPVIMGRKTYESIGRPLPGRQNIVITTNTAFQAPGCTIAHSAEAALATAMVVPEVCIIGGALLYAHLLPRIERIYLTVIHQMFTGDAYFPVLSADEWTVSAPENHAADAENPYNYSFMTYDRIGR